MTPNFEGKHKWVSETVGLFERNMAAIIEEGPRPFLRKGKLLDSRTEAEKFCRQLDRLVALCDDDEAWIFFDNVRSYVRRCERDMLKLKSEEGVTSKYANDQQECHLILNEAGTPKAKGLPDRLRLAFEQFGRKP